MLRALVNIPGFLWIIPSRCRLVDFTIVSHPLDEAPLSVLVQALTQRVDSVTQLDVLLLVYAGRGRVWSAPDVAIELRIGADWAQQHLDALARRGLLARDHTRYVPTPQPDLGPAVGELARLYRTHPVSIITAIYRPDKRLEDFAAAFRIRKAPPSGPDAGGGGGAGDGGSGGGGGGGRGGEPPGSAKELGHG